MLPKKDSRFPNVGMKYEDVRTRVNRISNYTTGDPQKKGRLVNSLINQASLHEGEGARTELENEVCYDSNNHSGNKLGYSPRYGKSWDRIFGSGTPQKP